VRRVLLVVALLFGIACFAFGRVDNILLLALGFGALRFLGQGSLMLCSANLVAQWFSRKRGFALSLMALGFSASVAIHPPLAQWLIDQVGWRETWLWLGLISWALLLPLILLLIQNKPEDLGLVPDGRVADDLPRIDRADVGLSASEALRTPAFWIIALSFATFSMSVTGLFFHQVAIFNNRGISSQTAAQLFPVSALTMVVAMPLFGRLLDRLPTRPMFACAMLTMTATMLALVMVQGVPSAIASAAWTRPSSAGSSAWPVIRRSTISRGVFCPGRAMTSPTSRTARCTWWPMFPSW
jgi:sugar phosphate permease